MFIAVHASRAEWRGVDNVITEANLTKRLIAHVECEANLPTAPETAAFVVRCLAPKILSILKEELAEERRKRPAKECQI